MRARSIPGPEKRAAKLPLAVRAGVCLLAMLWCTGALAGVHLHIDRLADKQAVLRQLTFSLDAGSAGQLVLQAKAASVDMAALGWHKVGMTLDGVITRSGPQSWMFEGSLALSGAPGGLLRQGQLQFTLDADANNIGVAIVDKSIRISAALPLDQPSHARINLTNVPLAWLQGLLSGVWSGRLTGGSLDGVMALDMEGNGFRSSSDVTLKGAGFDAEGGKLAGQGLDMRGHVTVDTTGKQDTLAADLLLQGGQWLLGPMYAALPKHQVHLSMQAVMERYGISLRHLRFTDPGTLHLSGAMFVADDGHVRNVNLTRFSASLPGAYTRYGKAWLATLGYANLKTAGELEGSFWMDAHGLRALQLNASQVTAQGARLAVSGLDGALDWRRGATRPATSLAWKQLAFSGIDLGAAQTHWRTENGQLTLQQPVAMALLGGQLHVNRLAWNPQAGNGQHLGMSLALTDIDVAQLSKAFGWPHFTGTLGGAIPGLRYVGNHVELDGGLSLSVFGGFVQVTNLAVQHPFGATPVLVGDVHLGGLNLASLTSVFDFGRITGRLDGDVKQLRLVNWTPVAFQASLTTTGKGGRISQRAVNNLTSVGGGGLATGLQGAVMKLFDSFGYSRIGLSCTLRGSVCHMQGIKPVDDGYLIVEGRGLPHLSVIGHQHEVSWPILVARLKAAIHGGGPVIK